MNYENEHIEFKENVTSNINKEVVAFANTNGGIIRIGVDDNGNAIGLADIDDSYTRLTNIIRDTILPDITMFVQYKLNDNNTIDVSKMQIHQLYYLHIHMSITEWQVLWM